MDNSDSLLLAEYHRLIDSFWKSEELGERRVTFFITLTTAVITALVAIRGKEISFESVEVGTIFFLGLLSLLLFGIVTLTRIIHRNLESHQYLRAAARIRRYFTDRDETILGYLYYGPYDDQPHRKKEWREIFSRGTGGLVEMVALANSLILAALFALLASYFFPWWVFVPLGLLGFILAWICQFICVKHCYEKEKPKKEEIMFPNRKEIEATLIICAEKPRVVARKIAGLTSIANYQLLHQTPKTIHDLYFDTPGRILQSQKLALRVRYIGAMCWIALKGPSRSTNWTGVERLEIEELWSKNAFIMMLEGMKKLLKERELKKLMGKKIKMLQQRQDFAHPVVDIMKSLELEVVQERKTNRQIRNIVLSKSGPVLAELAIDSVDYHFSNQTICHYEVEIEVKVREGSVIETTSESLVEMYGTTLRRWNHSKLATGKGVENLLYEGALEGLLDSNNNLKPVAYDKIYDYLTRSGI